MINRIPRLAIILLISHSIAIIGGYFIRDAVLLQRKESLANVLVVERYNEHSYKLEISSGQFNATICPQAKLDWQPGQKMKLLVYEQQVGCKQVVGNGLGFQFLTDDRGNRLQFSVNPQIASKGD